MALLLNIETATKNCSVGLAKDGETIVLREIATQNFSHAEKLHVFIEELFLEANLKLQDLDAIAVSLIDTIKEIGVEEIHHTKYCDDAFLQVKKD